MKSITVFCGSSSGFRPEYAEAARQLGRNLVEQNIRLVYGGGAVGLMGIIADEVMKNGGEVIGIIPEALDKKEVTLDYIKPKLKNWDPDRIAVLDMILMRLGVCEFLYFETIPPKVTINEYIDLAKDYSTAQSGQFVNGILDNIHKELVQDGKMQKSEYKKQ